MVALVKKEVTGLGRRLYTVNVHKNVHRLIGKATECFTGCTPMKGLRFYIALFLSLMHTQVAVKGLRPYIAMFLPLMHFYP